MKTVFFFIESLSAGGAEKVFTDLIRNIDKEKYAITVCTVSNNGIYDEEVKKYCKIFSILDINDYNKGGVNKAKYCLKSKCIYSFPSILLYKYIAREKYDIEIAFVEGFATRIISASTNKKSKKFAWIHIDMEKNPYASYCYKNDNHHLESYRKFDGICCVSRSVKDVFSKKFFDSDKVMIQYNPVDSVEIEKKGKEIIDLEINKTLQLGTIGRLENQKGYIRLIQCLGLLRKEGYDYSLWILGEGTQRSELEVLIKRFDLEDKIKLLGFQSNPYKYISKCDAFICSSYAEGFSTAATESLILGKPIFTTECAGMKELFGEYNCGEIVDNSDEDLLDMLQNLLSGNWKPENYINDVQQRAVDFDIRKRIEEIEQLLDK